MKIKQKLIFLLTIFFGIFFISIGKAQAASLILSPSSGIAGTQVTISGNEFMPHLPLVTAQWDDSNPLEISNKQFDVDGRYVSSTAQVPAGASVGQHKITVTVSAGALMYGPKHYWFSYIVPRAWAADGSSAETFFTVTAPPETPPLANTNSGPTNSTESSTNANTNTQVSKKTNTNTNQVATEPEPAAPTVTTDTPEPTAKSEPINEVKEGAEMCYFPWWLWLVLILITAVNLALFWVRYWKKKPKNSDQKN